MIQTFSFYTISAILVFSALMVVVQRNIFTCALYLAAALSMVGGLFVLLGADFLASVQILLYVGGILVIMAFAVMLSSIQDSRLQPQVNEQWPASLIVSVLLLLIFVFAVKKTAFQDAVVSHVPSTKSIGMLLLGDMILPFEVVSLVLLASLIGAVIFSKKKNN